MKDVRITKAKLVERVRANRDEHRKTYEAAIEGYRKAVIDFFNEQVDRAKAGHHDFAVMFGLPKPEDHTNDYDRVLDMIAMEEEGVITLSASDFAQYVRDEWGWQREFTATTSNYLR